MILNAVNSHEKKKSELLELAIKCSHLVDQNQSGLLEKQEKDWKDNITCAPEGRELEVFGEQRK